MKIIHETMKTLKKITFGRVLGLIAVLCVCWVSILVSVEFYAARKSSEYQGDVYSSMYDMSGKCGVIDKKGKWVLGPSYDCIHTPQYGKRIFDVGKLSGVLDDSLQILLPAEYKYIQLLEHYMIADKQDGSQVQIGYDGKVLNENIYSGVTILEYDSFEKTKDGGETIKKPTGLYSYSVYNSYGLMGQNGKPITPVLYDNITAISKDLFLCTLKDSYSSVIIDRKGTVIRNEAVDLY